MENPDDTTDDTTELDLSSATEDQLVAEHDRLKAEIASLGDQPRTLATAKQTVELRSRKNEVVTALNAIRQLKVEESNIEDEALIEKPIETSPAAEAPAEAPAAETAEAPAAEAPAAEAPAAEETVQEVEAVVEEAITAPDAAPAEAPAADATPAEATEAPAEPVAEVTEEPEAAPAPETTTATEAATAEPGTTQKENTVADANDSTPDPGAAEAADVVSAAEQILETAPEPVTAAQGRPSGPTDVQDRPQVGYRAMGGQSLFSQGTLVDFSQIGEIMSAVKNRRPEPGAGRIDGIVASLPGFADTPGLDEQVIGRRMSAEDATRALRDTVVAWENERYGRNAVTAAICTPLDILREIPQCGDTSTPFADLFPQRPITRLGFQFFPSMSASEADSGIEVWTDTEQGLVDEADSDTWKSTVDIECAAATQATAVEVTASARVDTSTELSQPEHVEEFMYKLAVQRARRREQHLLSTFDQLASPFYATGKYGSTAALIIVLNELLPQLVYGERLSNEEYDLVLEPGHMAKLVQDEAARVFGDTFALRREGIINTLKDTTGVMNVVETLDFWTGSFDALPTPNGAPAALPDLPDANRIRLVPSGSFLYGATGEEATGWETDPQLVRQNKMQWFSKEWILLAKHGCAPAAFVDLVSYANGSRADGVTPVDLSAS